MGLYIDGYEIDVEESADPSFDDEATEYPVEAGSDITDHVIVKPVRLSVSGVVSNTPIGKLRDRRQQWVDIDGEVFFLPADEADAFLRRVRTRREPVTVSCSRGTFDNMLMTRYAPQGSRENALIFSADFQQVEIVTNNRITLRVVSRPKKRKRGYVPSIEAPSTSGIDGFSAVPLPNESTQFAVDGVPDSLRPSFPAPPLL